MTTFAKPILEMNRIIFRPRRNGIIVDALMLAAEKIAFHCLMSRVPARKENELLAFPNWLKA